MASMLAVRDGWNTCESSGERHVLSLAADPFSRYGMVLAKEKNETKAMEWFLRSVHLFPMNWGCWQEMTTLMTRIEDVRVLNTHGLLSRNS